MSAPDDVVMKAADSIATGEQVDWQGLRKESTNAEQSRILTEMQVLERIATFLRTDTEAVPPEPTTRRQAPPMPASWMHFRLLELIGEGGFGYVYRARDTKLQSDVALKLIELPAGSEVNMSAALREPRLLVKIRHNNVVRVYGADVSEGRVGIWMELIEGQVLSSLLRANGSFGAHEAALIGVDLCRALAAVHAKGLVHGDVKTRNVMREEGGRTVLMDLGAGKDLRALRLQGSPETVAGTPLYLAPEIFDGEPQNRATDLYSLGVLLFHLVTNAYPVKGATQAEVEDAHRRGDRLNLRDARPDLPQSFITLVERAISREPRERFQTAGAFESALADFLGQPRPAPTFRWHWVTAAGVAALLAAVGLGAIWAERRLPPVNTDVTSNGTTPAPTVVSAGDYRIEASLYKHGERGDTRLRAGDRVAPGDALFMMLHVSSPAYIYIVNEDDVGESYLLFPLPGYAVTNPLVAETQVRVPGTREEVLSWQVSSVGGREHFLIFASPERLETFEELVANLPRPVIGKPISTAEKIPAGALSKLRSVGGLTRTEPPSPSSVHLANLFSTPLADGAESAHGFWVRQLIVENPIKARR